MGDDPGSWYYDPWFISIASVVVGILIAPALTWFADWVRSRKGPLSGTYVGLTRMGDDAVLVERVACWQIGGRVRGRIEQLLRLRFPDGGRSTYETSKGRYRFAGRCPQDALLVTYFRAGADAEGGTLNLMEVMDDVFEGYAVGYSRYFPTTQRSVASEPCLWLRYDLPRRPSTADVALTAEAVLSLIPNRLVTDRFREGRRFILTKMNFTLVELIETRKQALRNVADLDEH